MKTEEEIDVIVDKLKMLWKKNPQQRLCQLLSNITKTDEYKFYYIEDKNVEKYIDKYLNKDLFND